MIDFVSSKSKEEWFENVDVSDGNENYYIWSISSLYFSFWKILWSKIQWSGEEMFLLDFSVKDILKRAIA